MKHQQSVTLAICAVILLANGPQNQLDTSANVAWTEVSIPRAVPDAIKPSGAHGTVVIEGDISADLHVTNAHIVSSSHSIYLDDYALNMYGHASLTPSTTTKNASKIRLKIRLYNAGLDSMDWKKYSCLQADLDADWYGKTFPGEREVSPLYEFLSAAGTLIGVKVLSFARKPSVFEQAWAEAIEDCRTHPQAWFAGRFIAIGNKKKR